MFSDLPRVTRPHHPVNSWEFGKCNSVSFFRPCTLYTCGHQCINNSNGGSFVLLWLRNPSKLVIQKDYEYTTKLGYEDNANTNIAITSQHVNVTLFDYKTNLYMYTQILISISEKHMFQVFGHYLFFWDFLLDQRCRDSWSMPTDSNGRQLFSLQFTALFWWLMYLNYYAISSHQCMNLHTNESMLKFQ